MFRFMFQIGIAVVLTLVVWNANALEYMARNMTAGQMNEMNLQRVKNDSPEFPAWISFARCNGDLRIQLGDVNKLPDSAFAACADEQLEISLNLSFTGESIRDKCFKFKLTKEEPQMTATIPLQELGRGPWLLEAELQFLLFVKPGMVGREKSFGFMRQGGILLHAEGVEEGSFSVKNIALPAMEDLPLEKGTDWLQVRGKHIVDSTGTPFRLVGMARCQWHDTEELKDFGPLPMQLEHYRKLGINCIRLAFSRTRSYAKKNDLCKDGIEDFITRYIDPEVQAIINAGMYVILDDHTISQSLEDAYQRIPLWEALAERYADEARIAIFEPWNESYLLPTGLSPASAPGLRKWYKDCIAAIRKYDKRHIIMVSDWNAGWGYATSSMWAPDEFRPDPAGSQIVFSKHMAKDHCTEEYVNGALNAVADRWNVPLLIGELELEPGLQTAADLQNLLKILSENANNYGVLLWRPHPDKVIFTDIWSAWAVEYASVVPFSAKPLPLKWQHPTAAQNWSWNTGDESPAGFTLRNSALSIPQNCKQYEYRVIDLNQEFSPGIYDFEFVLENDLTEKLNPIGIFLLGKTGKQTLLFNANGNMKTKNINCFISEPFSGIVLKKMQNQDAECVGFRKIVVTPHKLLLDSRQ